MNTKTNLVNQDSKLTIQPASEDQLDFIELCIERQNQKQKQLIANKAAMEKQNEQAAFYLAVLKVGILFGLLVITLCIAAHEQANTKAQQQIEQLEKARVGGAK